MVDISKILKDIVARSGMEQERFGETIGLKKAAFNNYVQGRRELPKSVITKMMEVHNINPAVFFDKDAPLFISDLTKPTNIIKGSQRTVKIPVLGKIACGDPILAEENIKEYRYESPERMPSGTTFYLEAAGDSMEPTIPDGSYVLIREQCEVEYGEVAAVLVNGDEEATLKRVRKHGKMIMLMPDNAAHEPYIIDLDNPAKIIGKAIRFTQDL